MPPNNVTGLVALPPLTTGISRSTLMSRSINSLIDALSGRTVTEMTIKGDMTITGTMTASDAVITGSVTATSGAVGGFAIGADYMRDAANSFGLASTVSVGDDVRGWAGATFANRATAPLRWTEAGAFVATSATITGAITATSGTIGSFTIGTYLYTGTKTAYNDANAGVHVGSDGIGLRGATGIVELGADGTLFANSATVTGSVTATSGAIGGFIIQGDYFEDAADSFGLVSTVTAGDDVRLWAGSTLVNRATAPFRITESGALVATSATITGAVNATSGYFGSLANGVTVDATGVTLAGTGHISTATSSARVEMLAGGIKWYDATTQRGQILNDGSGWMGSSTAFAWTTAGVLTAGGWTVGATTLTSSNITLDSGNNRILIAAGGDYGTPLLAFGDSTFTYTTQHGALRYTTGTYPDLKLSVYSQGNMGEGDAWNLAELHLKSGGAAGSAMAFYINARLTNGATTALLKGSYAGDITAFGSFYPNNQATRYISDDGTYTTVSAGLATGSSVLPTTSDNGALGSTTNMWSDLYLASGAVVNFNDGDVTLTHAANTLTFAGATTGYIFNDGYVGIGKAPAVMIDATGTVADYGYSLANTNASGSGLYVDIASDNAARLLLGLVSNGGYKLKVMGDGGVVVGAPTGADKGLGTVNAVAVYDDGAGPLTDWVFDLYYDGKVSEANKRFWTGQPLYSMAEARSTTMAERHLPWMPTAQNIERERSLGKMVTRLWQGQEQQQIYIMELEARIADLEAIKQGV